METLNAIRFRRTIRSFKSKAIEYEKLIDVLDAARWAPAAGNLHNIKLLVIEDSDSKRKVAEACLGQDWLSTAPVLVILCSQDSRLMHMFPKQAQKFSVQNVALAAENMLLAATDLGLGSAYAAVGSDTLLRTYFQIPDNIKIHGVLAFGYSNETPEPIHKLKLPDITFFHKWGNSVRKESSFPLQKQVEKLKKVVKKEE